MLSTLARLDTSSIGPPENEEKRAIYVGNLPVSITEGSLREIFSISGSVHSVKLIGKPTPNAGNNYAFVEYDDPASAQNAIATFNGRTIFDCPIKVNWAYQSTSVASAREETSSHFTIFVGDLATEVNDEALKTAFSAYGTLSDARVMWDMSSGRSRGYGFVSFVERTDAEAAIEQMSGKWLGSRSIRCNWANQKQSTSNSPVHVLPSGYIVQNLDVAQQSLAVAGQASHHISTIYVGNLAVDTAASDLSPLFDTYGGAQDIKMHTDRGFAFVKLASHQSAALAIVQLQGIIVKGRPIKCSWQLKSDVHGRQRSRSSAGTVPSHYILDSSSNCQQNVYPSQMVPRQIFAAVPPQVMTPEQLLGLQVLQQQQTVARLSNQIAAMVSTHR